MPAWVWFSFAVLLCIAELVGGEFVLLMIGGGALVTAVVSLIPGADMLWLQLLVFALTSLALVFGLRPRLKEAFLKPSHIRTGIDAIIGSKASVISTVDSEGGQIKIGGEVWSAVGVDGHRPLPPGTPVTVVEVRGATAVVIWGP
ncbi:MAG TPA: NfeD family protein [Nakamurella sp.]|jgi:membrane protein implicated in regulation of membrane protease activity